LGRRAVGVLVDVLLTRLGRGEVGEVVAERHVVGVYAIVEDADQCRVEAEVRVAAVEHGVGRAGHGQQLDLHDVVGRTAAVGEAAGVAAQHAQPRRRGRAQVTLDVGVDADHLRRDNVGGTVDVEARRQRDRAALRLDGELVGQHHAGQEDVEDVAAAAAGRARHVFRGAVAVGVAGQRHAVEAAQQVAHLRVFHAFLQRLIDGQVDAGGNAVEHILQPHRQHHFVDERHAQARYLHVVVGVGRDRRIEHVHRRAA